MGREVIVYGNELYHHGIKGQQWGVRRYQNEDGTLTEAGKEHYYGQRTLRDANKEYNAKKIKYAVATGVGAVSTRAYPMGFTAGGAIAGPAGAAVGAVAGIGIMMGGLTLSTKAKEDLENYVKKPVSKTNEILIKKGDKFVRTSLKSEENPNERIYVTYSKDKSSREEYETTWGNVLRRFAGDPDAKVYQNTYTVKTDIVAPSLLRRKEAANSIVNASKKMRIELGKAYALDQIRLMTNSYKEKTLSEVLNKFKNDSAARKYVGERYKQMVSAVTKPQKLDMSEDINFKKFTASIPTSSKLMNAYIKELKKDGFTAVFDDNANSTGAFILFDSSSITQTGSKDISKNFT